ncbi:MAG TPA: sigma-54 dependent transcriptional regulator [Anaeromyxobacteraceae bacterium]|nr:sigma-54 dependent transcriptional regulator [Anaeromyxobacteraceae bacterium]
MTQPSCVEPFERGALCSVCRLNRDAPGLGRCSRLVAESNAMRTLLTRAAPIAASNESVIILGESGSGKEVLARAIHSNSPRKAGPFVAVNVAALPAELLESELFGHAKGAFTGASTNKRGLFEVAGSGTLLLDEIAEMPLGLQAKLLRALQDGEIRRVGETRPFTVDVRVLCATNQDLRACVSQRRFREDLYYRLRVFTLEVPSLRQRIEDIMPLATMFLRQQERGPTRFTGSAEKALKAHRWPGNVRELVNAVKHGAVLAEGEAVDVEHLPEEVVHPSRVFRGVAEPLRTLEEVERDHILRVLEECGGRQVEAARILGIGRTTLWRHLRSLGISETA